MIDRESLAAIREGLTVYSGATISVDQLANDYISLILTGKPENSVYDVFSVARMVGVFTDKTEVDNGKK